MNAYYIPDSQKNTHLNTDVQHNKKKIGRMEYSMLIVVTVHAGNFCFRRWDSVHVRIRDFAASYLGRIRKWMQSKPLAHSVQ